MWGSVDDPEVEIGVAVAQSAAFAAPSQSTAALRAANTDDDENDDDEHFEPASNSEMTNAGLRELKDAVLHVVNQLRASHEELQRQFNLMRQSQANASYESPGYGAGAATAVETADSSPGVRGGSVSFASDAMDGPLVGPPALALRSSIRTSTSHPRTVSRVDEALYAGPPLAIPAVGSSSVTSAACLTDEEIVEVAEKMVSDAPADCYWLRVGGRRVNGVVPFVPSAYGEEVDDALFARAVADDDGTSPEVELFGTGSEACLKALHSHRAVSAAAKVGGSSLISTGRVNFTPHPFGGAAVPGSGREPSALPQVGPPVASPSSGEPPSGGMCGPSPPPPPPSTPWNGGRSGGPPPPPPPPTFTPPGPTGPHGPLPSSASFTGGFGAAGRPMTAPRVSASAPTLPTGRGSTPHAAPSARWRLLWAEQSEVGVLHTMCVAIDYTKTAMPTMVLLSEEERHKAARKRFNAQIAEAVLLAPLHDKLTTLEFANARRRICQQLAPHAFSAGDATSGDALVASVMYSSMEYFAARGKVAGNSFTRLSKAIKMVASDLAFDTDSPSALWRVIDMQFSGPASNWVHELQVALQAITIENGYKPSDFITEMSALLHSYKPNTRWDDVRGHVLSAVTTAYDKHSFLWEISQWAESEEAQAKSMAEWESHFRRCEQRTQCSRALAAVLGKASRETPPALAAPLTVPPPAAPPPAAPSDGKVALALEQLTQVVAALQTNTVAPASGGASNSDPQKWARQWQEAHGVVGYATPNEWPRDPLWAAKVVPLMGKAVPSDLATTCPPGKMLGPDCPFCAKRMNPIAADKWFYHPRDPAFDGRLRPTGADKRGTMWMHELKYCPTVRDWVHRHVRANPADTHLFDPLPQGSNAAVAP